MHNLFVPIVASLSLSALLQGTLFGASVENKPSPMPSPVAVSQAVTQVTPPPPSPQPRIHVVELGDSLSSIAAAEELESWVPLWNANPEIEHPDLIYAGQQLTIPEGETTERPIPANTTLVVPVKQTVVQRSNPVPATSHYAVGASGILERIRMRESGGNYAINTGNGYYGAYQFSLGTWKSVGGSGLPSEASPAEQDMRAQMLYDRRGCSPWPSTCY